MSGEYTPRPNNTDTTTLLLDKLLFDVVKYEVVTGEAREKQRGGSPAQAAEKRPLGAVGFDTTT